MSSPSIRLRPATEEDIGFIFNSWLKSYKFSLFAKNITNTIYYAEHHKVIEKLLKNHQTIIACNNDDISQIYGFINAGFVDGIFCLNYIYVKQPFRNLGVGKTLLNSFDHDPSNASVVTHWTRMAERLAPKYNMVYHPYLMFNLKESSNESDKE
jgi:GNAT superfamily N-acetyltransferase